MEQLREEGERLAWMEDWEDEGGETRMKAKRAGWMNAVLSMGPAFQIIRNKTEIRCVCVCVKMAHLSGTIQVTAPLG